MPNPMEYHEAANIFPLDEGSIGEMAKDIGKFGLQVPIETLDGKIIDGRRRYLACEKAGVRPQYRAVAASDPVAYVVSLNLHRRHLTTSQRAMCAARAKDVYTKMAKDRETSGIGPDGSGGRGHKKNPTANLPEGLQTGEARVHAGRAFGVGGRTVGSASRLLKNGVPELVKAVDDGLIAVGTAEEISTQSPELQREAAAQPELGKSHFLNRQDQEEENTNGKMKGVGVIRANEAINCLTRIPKNDQLRKRGFQIVMDWIRHNR